MSISMDAAKEIVLKNLPDADILSAIDYQEKYLFIARTSDPLEGMLDPFFSVQKVDGYFRDFSPQDYPNPGEVIDRLQSAARK